MLKIINVIGARPNYMKVAPLHKRMLKTKGITPILVHTGQHYGAGMSDIFLQQLGIKKVDYHLNVGSNTHARQTAAVLVAFEDILLKEKPDMVVVVGDVNSTVACSLAAVKLHIPVAHVEAGLRSYDWDMPEEHNRKVTDNLSSLLLTSCRDGNENLAKEGLTGKKVKMVGNTMIDSLVEQLPAIRKSKICRELELSKGEYALMTLHRPSNVDSRDDLLHQLDIIDMIQQKIRLVFPMHPRTLKMLKSFKLYKRVQGMANLTITPPVSYFDFIKLLMDSKVVLTDSGGIQEESTYLKIPCLTLRENTERPITITEGTNILTGTRLQTIKRHLNKILKGDVKKSRIPRYWDGKTSGRIIAAIQNSF